MTAVTHEAASSRLAEESIVRRLQFAASSQVAIDSATRRLGLGAVPDRLRHASHIAANLLYDSGEWLRSGFRLRRPGQIHLAALEAPGRLPQPPACRGYWYDPEKHACIGMHIGLDLLRNRGKYYVIEANLGAALRENRRALYSSRLDPYIATLLEVAVEHDFKRIVMLRSGWSSAQLDEFALAERESGIEVIGASTPFLYPEISRSASGLPEALQESTLYVLFSGQGTPLSLFMHDKLWAGRWLQDGVDETPPTAELLAYTPTYSRITLPDEPQDPRWPNLVVKLASGDSGKFVVLGRFRSEAHVREELQLGNPGDLPGVFNIGIGEKLIDRLFPRLQTIYQPYIAPDLLEGRICKIRLHAFISPLADRFLSAHDTIGCAAVPETCPEGLISDIRPYVSSYSALGGDFVRCAQAEEPDLERACREYGRLAKTAISRKFEIAPR